MTLPAAGGEAWWRGAVIYQIFPQSFCLADPDGRRSRLASCSDPPPPRPGAGDLAGIRRHLDHVASLGADAIWLSPIYPSPMRDAGYDVAGYCDVSPLYGDLAQFDSLLAEAHELNMKVLVDFVPNHTSSDHPWFAEARRSRESRYRDFYFWRDPDPDDPTRPPNNWRSSFTRSPAWTFEETSGQWYLHLFLPEQPDLDWSNAEVVAEMTGVLDFWAARGVDGFRIDVVHGLGKPPGLPDVAPEHADKPYANVNDEPSTHEILRHLRAHVEGLPAPPLLLGEVFLLDTEVMATYYGDDDELHLALNFVPMFADFSAGQFLRAIEEIGRHVDARGAWPTWVLSSHDRPRHRSRYGSERRARAAAVLSLAMRGTIILYAGEELGLEDAIVPEDIAFDPGGRDGCRAPLPWDETPEHGWSLEGGLPLLPFPPRTDRENVAAEHDDEGSVLSLYRRLISLRRRVAALRLGDLHLIEGGASELVCFTRTDPDQGHEGALVLVNFAPVEQQLSEELAGFTVAVSSGGEGALLTEGEAFAGRLGPEEAAVCLGPVGALDSLR